MSKTTHTALQQQQATSEEAAHRADEVRSDCPRVVVGNSLTRATLVPSFLAPGTRSRDRTAARHAGVQAARVGRARGRACAAGAWHFSECVLNVTVLTLRGMCSGIIGCSTFVRRSATSSSPPSVARGVPARRRRPVLPQAVAQQGASTRTTCSTRCGNCRACVVGSSLRCDGGWLLPCTKAWRGVTVPCSTGDGDRATVDSPADATRPTVQRERVACQPRRAGCVPGGHRRSGARHADAGAPPSVLDTLPGCCCLRGHFLRARRTPSIALHPPLRLWKPSKGRWMICVRSWRRCRCVRQALHCPAFAE